MNAKFDITTFPKADHIQSNIDLNGFRGGDVWYINGNVTNGPGPNYGILFVFKMTDTMLRQLFIAQGSDEIYTRRLYNNAWLPWVLFQIGTDA